MKEDPSQRDSSGVVFSLSDIFSLCKKHKRLVTLIVVVCAGLGALYALTRPIEYEAKATFKETKQESGLGSVLKGFFPETTENNTSYDSLATMLHSRRLLVPLIEQQNLHVSLEPAATGESLWLRVVKNIQLEWAYWKESQQLLFPDSKKPLTVLFAKYDREEPLSLQIKFAAAGNFSASNEKEKIQLQGTLGKPVTGDGYSFAIAATQGGEVPALGTRYNLFIFPPHLVANRLEKEIVTTSFTDDKAVVEIAFRSSDRHEAVAFVNGLMKAFQGHLYKESEEYSKEQLHYLVKRQKELGSSLDHVMEDYVREFHAHLGEGGFMEVDQEIEYLTRAQAKYREELAKIVMELGGIDAMRKKKGGYGFSEQRLDETQSRIYQLTTRADSLKLALAQKNEGVEQREQLIAKKQEELKKVKGSIAYLEKLQQALVDGTSIADQELKTQLLDPATVSWLESFQRRTLENSADVEGSYQRYLQQLSRIFEIRKNMIEDNLVAFSFGETEFHGIDLVTADTLFAGYQKQIDSYQLEAKAIQLILGQMQRPDFEVSSLTGVLQDSVSQSLATRASDLVLRIHNEKVRSKKEEERLREELDVEKKFLFIHLSQLLEVNQLREQQAKKKVQLLQQVVLELLHQEIAVLHKQMADRLDVKEYQLLSSENRIKTQLVSLNESTLSLPEKWKAEQQLKFWLQIYVKMFDEVAKAVETKNMSINLQRIESHPIDFALLPLLPMQPGLKLFTLAGACLGFFFGVGLFFARSVLKGVPASQGNLAIKGCHIAGAVSRASNEVDLTALPSKDLATLRKLAAFLVDRPVAKPELAQLLLLVLGQGPQYQRALAQLLSKAGKRVLIVHTQNGKQHGLDESGKGFLLYLEGKVDQPAIDKKEGHDEILSGGSSPYYAELFHSPRFDAFLTSVADKYDWVFLACSAAPTSAEALFLLSLSNAAVVTIENEWLHELDVYMAQEKTSRTSFLFFNGS
ncbi:hypothetical protein JYU14_01475 [Simkania negevensis]|uniref:Polysaccharide chain length determinant N-terminal domain-containing protein n=1 Tax=Simkania negevensis TaxID=83561 RepID=A0ABS3AR15_9BACT|nr:hypothetical protein [Simkania negevensis]